MTSGMQEGEARSGLRLLTRTLARYRRNLLFAVSGALIWMVARIAIPYLIGVVVDEGIIAEDRLVFSSRGREREIKFSDMEWMHIGREMLVQTAGGFQLIIFKMKGRKRLFRIRVGRYERGHVRSRWRTHQCSESFVGRRGF